MPLRPTTPGTRVVTPCSQSAIPEKLTDFAYRAVHEMTVQSKSDHLVLLRSRRAVVLLERLFDRWPSRADVGAEVP